MDGYLAVFCDIDGTLLTSGHQVTPGTAEKIRELSRRGVPFVLTSSRMPAAIYPVQEEIGIRGPIVSYGGSLVLDENRNPLESVGVSMELASRIWKEFPPETEECCFCAYSGDTWIATDRNHPLIRLEEEITSAFAVSGSMEEILPLGAPIHKLWGSGPAALMDETALRLKEKFPRCTICKSAPHLLEIMDGRVSKAHAVHVLCEKWGISPEETVSFGDNYNDMEMLQATGMSVVMGNAPKEVKAAASWTTADNDHEGLLLALNRLFP